MASVSAELRAPGPASGRAHPGLAKGGKLRRHGGARGEAGPETSLPLTLSAPLTSHTAVHSAELARRRCVRLEPSSEPLLTSSPPWQAVRIFPHSRPVLVRTYKAHSPHFNHCLEKISLWHLFHFLLYCKDYSVLPHDYI